MARDARSEARDARIRGVWYASRGETTEDAIARAARCTKEDAFLVATLRRAAGIRVALAWAPEDNRLPSLTLQQLERVVLLFPFDEDAQVEEACSRYPTARGELRPAA